VSEKKLSLCFSERMQGFVTLGASTDFDVAYRQGRASQTPCGFSLTIDIDDVDGFVRDPNAQADATGYLDCPALGGHCAVEKATVNLLVDVINRRHNVKDMRYRLHFRTPQGRALTLSGVKYVDNDGIVHVWRDTTKLFTRVFEGDVERGDEETATVVACGILRLGVWDFAKLLASFRSRPPSFSSWLRAATRFGVFFAKGLWQVYGLKFSRA
jgi:cholesterol oxidase